MATRPKACEGEVAYLAAYDAALKSWPVPYEEMEIPGRFGTTHVVAHGPKDAPPLVLLSPAASFQPHGPGNLPATPLSTWTRKKTLKPRNLCCIRPGREQRDQRGFNLARFAWLSNVPGGCGSLELNPRHPPGNRQPARLGRAGFFHHSSQPPTVSQSSLEPCLPASAQFACKVLDKGQQLIQVLRSDRFAAAGVVNPTPPTGTALLPPDSDDKGMSGGARILAYRLSVHGPFPSRCSHAIGVRCPTLAARVSAGRLHRLNPAALPLYFPASGLLIIHSARAW